MSLIPKIANLVINRLKLAPPIDVDAAIEAYADLEECDWTYDCDGVAWLASGRPRIFVKRTSFRRRKRFTKAHELAHVVIGWHLGNVRCIVDPTEDDHHETLRAAQEGEANLFASHLLVPDTLISSIALSYIQVPDALKLVEKADVSAAAGVMALRRVLLPGYAFQVPGVDHILTSSGTDLPSREMLDVEKRAIRCGVTIHQDREVRWAQLADAQEIKIASGDAKELLHSVLTQARPYQQTEWLGASINGVIGGVIGSSLARASVVEPEQLLGILKHKFEMHGQYADLMNCPQFEQFLSCRALAISDQRKKKFYTERKRANQGV